MSVILPTIPSVVIEGSEEESVARAEELLKEAFCPQRGTNCFCQICRSLQAHQHASLLWITPEKDFTVADLEPIFTQISLALDFSERFYFVLQRSQRLTQVTANRLLKILEEPPHGYHFLLLTNNANALLPTILSRSHVIRLSAPSSSEQHPILSLFLNQGSHDGGTPPPDLDQMLRNHPLGDSESITLVDQLFEEILARLRAATDDREQGLREKQLEILQTCMAMPPQSGSSNLFWKNLWLQMPR